MPRIFCYDLADDLFVSLSDKSVTMATSPRYLSTAQTGERLGMSREHVRRLIQQGELRADETVNGFVVNMDEVERFAAIRQVQRDQREFRSATTDLAAKARQIEGATALVVVAASLRDEAKLRSAFELPDAVRTQMEWMNQQVAANAAFAALQEPVKALTEQWHRMADDADRALKRADTGGAIPTWQEWAGSDRPEDVLARLTAIREEISGGRKTGENSTDVIRAAREARGGGA